MHACIYVCMIVNKNVCIYTVGKPNPFCSVYGLWNGKAGSVALKLNCLENFHSFVFHFLKLDDNFLCVGGRGLLPYIHGPVRLPYPLRLDLHGGDANAVRHLQVRG